MPYGPILRSMVRKLICIVENGDISTTYGICWVELDANLPT